MAKIKTKNGVSILRSRGREPCDYQAILFELPRTLVGFRSFTREIPTRAFREWPIAIKRNETEEEERGGDG